MKFFRIITADITTRSKLKLPRKFVKRYGANVPRNVRLQVPTRAEWRVEVKKNSDGVWLGKGWVKFAESLGIRYGHFLVFDYDVVHDVFHVLALDMSAVEIEYPTVSSIDDNEEEDLSGSRFALKRPKVEHEDGDVVIVNKDGANLGNKRRAAGQAPSGEPASKKATPSKVDQNTCGNVIVRTDGEKLKTDRNTLQIQRGCYGRETMLSSEGRIRCVVQGRRNGYGEQTKIALERAKAFKAEEPVCIITLPPSCVGQESPAGAATNQGPVLVPSSFIQAYFNLSIKDATLRTKDGRSWLVKYNLAKGRHESYFTSGWKQFAIDTDLKTGDVCLFELIGGAENALKVVIFRAMDEDRVPE
uniref:TF-B3 domain-containing protein n=2 Tax=Kalanchoe fedtschenkoi TaxID=63787 RepID=A0A7N0UU68_KALFE